MQDIDREYYEGVIAEWKQAASVEAGLRREFLARALKAEEELEEVNKKLSAALQSLHKVTGG